MVQSKSNPIVLYFGSFNPVHKGHISVARAAQNYYGEGTKVWFVLSAQSPFKEHSVLWSKETRWRKLVDAIGNEANMEACDVELNLPLPSYTVQTIRLLKKQNPKQEFVILMGEDNLVDFYKWKEYKSILEMCSIVVYPRNGKLDRSNIPEELKKFEDKIELLEGSLFPFSSTQIRKVDVGTTFEQWAEVLQWRGDKADALREYARKIKIENVGNSVYLRGLIEYSNCCSKNCFYCGIRRDNIDVNRYAVEDNEVIKAAEFAYKEGFGSIVLQAGERIDRDYVRKIENLIKSIMTLSNGELGITLSLGEQSKDVFKRWRDAGAKRYLLRIETSNQELYKKLHPLDHSFAMRIKALGNLKDVGFQVGTGIMIGLPWQSNLDLAKDIDFFKQRDIDMIGMGPYIEHHLTPLYEFRELIPSLKERYETTLNMLSLLRIQMPTINIASTTAMATLDPKGREEALRIAANVIMPNITPYMYRENYFLYENKLCICESEQDSKAHIEKTVRDADCEIAYFKHGDSKHYFDRIHRKY